MPSSLKRSSFLASAAALAATAFLRDVSIASEAAASVDLTPLIETLLPFGSAAFPDVSSAAIVARIDALFHLDQSPVFQASLLDFSKIIAFPKASQALLGAEATLSPGANGSELTDADAAAFGASGLRGAGTFSALSPPDRVAYVRLWTQSAFAARRRFYGSLRTLTFVAFYSMPDVWKAIDYAGPLLHVVTAS